MQLSFWFVFLWWHMLWNIFVISLFTICISFWWGNSSGLLTIFYSIFSPYCWILRVLCIFSIMIFYQPCLCKFFFGLWWLVCSFSWDPFFLISFFSFTLSFIVFNYFLPLSFLGFNLLLRISFDLFYYSNILSWIFIYFQPLFFSNEAL